MSALKLAEAASRKWPVNSLYVSYKNLVEVTKLLIWVQLRSQTNR